MLARAAMLSVLLVPAAFSPSATALVTRIVLPPKPLISRPLVAMHQIQLSRMQNHVLIQQAGSTYGAFVIQQSGFPEVKAADINALMRTLKERQGTSPHEALKIIPDFQDTAQHELFSAQLKTKRPSYFRDATTPQLSTEDSVGTRLAFSTARLSSVQPDGVVFSTKDGRWAQDMNFGPAWHRHHKNSEFPRTVRVLSTLKDLVEDLKNYLVWAYNHLVRTRSATSPLPTAEMVVHLALEQLAADTKITKSELRELVTVQFGGLDVVLLGQDATFAAVGWTAILMPHEAH